MKLPYLRSGVGKNQRTVGQWDGVDERLIIDDSSFSSMKNMSTRFFPAIGTRLPRSVAHESLYNPHGLYDKDGLFWVAGIHCYYLGATVADMTVTSDDKQIVGMGAYICVFPDKKIYNTVTGAVTNMDASYYQNNMEIVFSELTPDSVFTKIRGSHISDNFKKGDGVVISGIDDEAFLVDGEPATKIITEVGENYFVVNAPIQNAWTGEATFRLRQTTPSGQMGTRIEGTGIAKYDTLDTIRISGCKDDALNYSGVQLEGFGTDCIFVPIPFPSKAYTQTDEEVIFSAYYEGSDLTRIEADDLGTTFTAGDVVTIENSVDGAYDGSFEIKQAGTNYILIEARTSETKKQNAPGAGESGLSITRTAFTQTGVTIKRKAMTTQGQTVQIHRTSPDMDFVCEHGNRLWGCNSEKHEIYACKLGDPTNWSCYEGIATDSYTATVGSDGNFTGCCAHMGYVLFFKEHSISVMYGDKPSNFQLSVRQMPGVRAGCDKSLCVVNETLYYVGRNGVYQYDGAIPKKISDNILSDISNAVAGTQDGKLYLSCLKDNVQTMMVYDPRYQIWDIEDDTQMKFATSHNGQLYYISADNKLKTIVGDGSWADNTAKIQWSIESGDLRESRLEQKWISKVMFNLWLDSGSTADIYIQFDDDPLWHRVWTVHSVVNKTYTIPIVPQRCSRFRWKMEGYGQAKILAMGVTVEGGSEINGSIQSWERH